MGQMIAVTADINRVAEHVRTALRNALARGEGIGEAAQRRLGEAVVAIDVALGAHEAASKAEANAWAVVQAEDARSDVAIGHVRDQMWNALGRPRQNAALDQVFPEGVGTYTAGDQRLQPVMMHVLGQRILAASSPRWTKGMREGWAADIEEHRQSYQSGVDAHRPTEASALIARTTYRAAVRAAHTRLRDFKRDLQSMGLDDVEIHTVIPTVPPRPTEVKQAA